MSKTCHKSSSRLLLLGQASAVFLIALAVRLIGASSNPVHIDELYHLLAGRSWAEDGSFRMLDGEYLRARGFTALIGLMFELFGRSDLLVARIPSIFAGALLVSTLFYWVSRQANARAGWISAMLFCFASYAIVFTQFARFYALQALLVWLAAAAIYKATRAESWNKAVILLVATAIALIVALHLQVTTAIAILALGLWALIDLSAQARVRAVAASVWGDRKIRWMVLLVLAGIVVMGALHAGPLLHQYRYTPQWAVRERDNVMFYFVEFSMNMPLLWLLLPFAAAVSLASWPRPALFCLTLGVLPIILHSFGGMKESRYVFYAFPFLFPIWGMAIAAIWPQFVGTFQRGVQGLQQVVFSRLPQVFWRVVTLALILITVVGAIVANPVYRNSAKMLIHRADNILKNPASLLSAPPDPPWSEHAQELREIVGNPSILIVGEDFHAIAYLPPFDLLINSNRVMDMQPPGEFVMDVRTGRRAIAAPETVAKVISCYPDGVIVTPEDRWRSSLGISPAAADTIESLTEAVKPVIPGFHIFKWQGRGEGQGCDKIRATVTGGRHQ